ncbi:MAG: riboflavin synthase [Nitrospiria bacterium]
MFTGIIEEIGVVEATIRNQTKQRLIIRAKTIMEELASGDSVAINGACMTAVDITSTQFSCDISSETASLTNLGNLKPRDQVNLERAMRLSDRLSGHLVSGHIEGKGILCKKHLEGNTLILSFDIPLDILKYCILKGSITLDGVSMTINSLNKQGITVSVIPHTAEATTLGLKEVGSVLNIESDLIGKYVERLLIPDRPPVEP